MREIKTVFGCQFTVYSLKNTIQIKTIGTRDKGSLQLIKYKIRKIHNKSSFQLSVYSLKNTIQIKKIGVRDKNSFRLNTKYINK